MEDKGNSFVLIFHSFGGRRWKKVELFQSGFFLKVISGAFHLCKMTSENSESGFMDNFLDLNMIGKLRFDGYGTYDRE